MVSENGEGKLLKIAQKAAAMVGLGMVIMEDPDYIAICEAHRTITLGMKRKELAAVASTLDRDFIVIRPDMNRLKRRDYEEQLRARFDEQIETDYREEPAHMIIRGRRAKVASRIFSKTIVRRGDKLIELRERGEHLTTWVKTTSGWKREITRIRFHEQDFEWITEAVVEQDPVRTQKILL
jgi:hypothetical protein